MAFMIPLYDSYPAPVRAENINNPRMSPIIAEVEKLPERMLLIVPAIDILVHEQLTFVERVKKEITEQGLHGRECEAKVVDGAFHGWLELPILPKAWQEKKDASYEMAIDFLRETHTKYGWNWGGMN
jgi:acetyl esterase/lipase